MQQAALHTGETFTLLWDSVMEKQMMEAHKHIQRVNHDNGRWQGFKLLMERLVSILLTLGDLYENAEGHKLRKSNFGSVMERTNTSLVETR